MSWGERSSSHFHQGKGCTVHFPSPAFITPPRIHTNSTARQKFVRKEACLFLWVISCAHPRYQHSSLSSPGFLFFFFLQYCTTQSPSTSLELSYMAVLPLALPTSFLPLQGEAAQEAKVWLQKERNHMCFIPLC